METLVPLALLLAVCQTAASDMTDRSNDIVNASPDSVVTRPDTSSEIPVRASVLQLDELSDLSSYPDGRVREGWPFYTATWNPERSLYVVAVRSEADKSSFRQLADNWLRRYTAHEIVVNTDPNFVVVPAIVPEAR